MLVVLQVVVLAATSVHVLNAVIVIFWREVISVKDALQDAKLVVEILLLILVQSALMEII